MNEQVGVAVIGCGYWGMNYVRLFNELSGARLAMACDQRPERLQEVQRRFPGSAVTTDIAQVLEHEGVEAVVICTEASSHYEVAQRCLRAGKHVLIEKPITTLASDGEHLVTQAATEALTLMVGHTFVYNAGIRAVKRYVEQQALGEVYYLYARRTNMGPIRRDVNAIWDLAPHDISIFNHLLDARPLWVSAVGARVLHTSREDVGFISLGYHNGIVGHIHVSWADPHKVREVVVVGSKQRIVFNDMTPQEPVRVFEKGVEHFEDADEAATFGEHQLAMRDGDIISPRVEPNEPLKAQCSHFIESIKEGSSPLTGGRQGVDVVRVMEAIERSVARNGAPVEIA